MDFIRFIADYIKNYNLSVEHFVADILLLFVLFTAFLFVFSYSNKHHAKRYYLISLLLLVLIVFLVAFKVITQAYLPVLIIIGLLICTVSLFSVDIRRDLYKLSLRRKDDAQDTINVTDEEARKCVNLIVKSCQTMSKSETGALIIISEFALNDAIIESGTKLNAELSSQLIETIFYPKCPLHDGAMVINGKTIVSAGCYLNITQQPNLPKELGTRHRAAIGISEVNPTVLAIVVSEESGIISAAYDGMHTRYLDAEMLTKIVEVQYKLSSTDLKSFFGGKENEN